MEIIIENKIGEKIDEYKKKTGASKSWIASQLGVSSQRLSQIIKSDNLEIKIVIKIALLLNCTLDDLFIYKKDTNHIDENTIKISGKKYTLTPIE